MSSTIMLKVKWAIFKNEQITEPLPIKKKYTFLAIHIQLVESVVSENFHYFRRAKIEFRVCEGNVKHRKYRNTKCQT